jgi:hypothetical protein
VAQLRSFDLEAVLGFVHDARSEDAAQPLTQTLLDRLTEIAGCNLARYKEIDLAKRIEIAYVPCTAEVRAFGFDDAARAARLQGRGPRPRRRGGSRWLGPDAERAVGRRRTAHAARTGDHALRGRRILQRRDRAAPMDRALNRPQAPREHLRQGGARSRTAALAKLRSSDLQLVG